MRRGLFLIILAGSFSILNAQKVEGLVYATPTSNELTFILPFDQENYKVVVAEVLYLLDKNNIIVDTLQYSSKGHEQILTCFWVGPALLSLNTFNKGSIVSVADGRFKIVNTVEYNSNFRKQLKKDYSFEKRPSTMNILAGGFLLKDGISKYILLINGNVEEIDQTNNSLIESEYRNRIFANNYLRVDNEALYIWNQFKNVYSIVNLSSFETTIIQPPLPIDNTGVNQIYFDRVTKVYYLWAWSAKQESKLYRIDLASNKYRLIKEDIPFIVRGIFNNKMYVKAPFDKSEGHYLIPIWGKEEPIKKLENVEINH